MKWKDEDPYQSSKSKGNCERKHAADLSSVGRADKNRTYQILGEQKTTNSGFSLVTEFIIFFLAMK